MPGNRYGRLLKEVIAQTCEEDGAHRKEYNLGDHHHAETESDELNAEY
jgi:hypothetical protein